jgi:hypothetical protein
MIRFDVPQVMGIVNMTPDSFSDGGKHIDDPQAAADAGFAMMAQGAAMVDVGGESTRPRGDKIWEGDEIARVVPVIERAGGERRAGQHRHAQGGRDGGGARRRRGASVNDVSGAGCTIRAAWRWWRRRRARWR